jgi:hypothetical protein
MTSLPRPRAATLEAFSGALLLVLGLAPIGCASDVREEDGGGGSGGSGSGPSGSGTGNPITSGGPSGSTTGASGTTSGGGSTTTGTSGTTGPGGTSSSSNSTGTGGGTGGCVNPTPLTGPDGQDLGLDRCDGGQLRRRTSVECPVTPDEEPCCGECPEGFFCSTQGEVACSCVEQCSTDADCADGSVCFCGSPAGWCVPSGCATGEDCADGQECTSWDPSGGCIYLEFDCTTPQDTCGGDLDCEGQLCAVLEDGHRECVDGGCAIGRPFLIDDAARTAAVIARGDWKDPATRPLDVTDPTLRARLADAWEHVARMEHASVAAFARFSLQLLSLGAPPDLLVRCHLAMADETRHARLAFALASAYRGSDVGPGPLSLEGALEGADDLGTFVSLLVREGCIGETVASLEAGEASAACQDPVVAAALAGIAEDESAHAELAWRTARWAVTTFGEPARAALTIELSRVEAELGLAAPAPATDGDAAMMRHGIATDATRAGLRREALTRAIVPCLRALAAAPRPATALSRSELAG